jgi:hypothetical protein
LAKGKRILALHGAQDENVPIAGGGGGKGVSRVAYASEAQSQRVFTAAGAVYTLQVVANADHKLDNLDAAIQRSEGVTLAEKTARYFGLDAPKP